LFVYVVTLFSTNTFEFSFEVLKIAFLKGFLNALAGACYIFALKKSDVSLCAPMLNITPLAMILTSFLILDELPSVPGALGIFAIVIGAYILTTEKQRYFAKIFKDKGVQLALCTAIIYSITANLDKLGVLLINAQSYITLSMFFSFIFLLTFSSAFSKKFWRSLEKKSALLLLPVACVAALALYFQLLAIVLTKASYVIAIKRLSTLMTALLGGKIFKEKEVRKRTLAACVMVIGVLLIVLRG